MFAFTDPIDYEPTYELSIVGLAERAGHVTGGVRARRDLSPIPAWLFMLHVSNYADGDGEALREMLLHPSTVLGLADGGAHVASVRREPAHHHADPLGPQCGAGRGSPRVRRPSQTAAPPLLPPSRPWRAPPGFLADLNVIDFDGLLVRRPEVNPRPARWRPPWLVQRCRRLRRHREARCRHPRARRAHRRAPRPRRCVGASR